MDDMPEPGPQAAGQPASARPPAQPSPDDGPVQDERLLAAAARVLQDAGWEGLTIEAVAEAAGLSRVTAWRLRASREALIASLLSQLGQDYRQAMWPAIVGTGTARERLDRAIGALFDVIDAHLPLLLASDTIFHRATATKINFNEPFTRADGTAGHRRGPAGGCAGCSALAWIRPGSHDSRRPRRQRARPAMVTA